MSVMLSKLSLVFKDFFCYISLIFFKKSLCERFNVVVEVNDFIKKLTLKLILRLTILLLLLTSIDYLLLNFDFFI